MGTGVILCGRLKRTTLRQRGTDNSLVRAAQPPKKRLSAPRQQSCRGHP